MNRMEMGGYLPLELSRGGEWFSELSEEQLLRVNTGRAALTYAVESLNVTKILAPAFYCPDVMKHLESLGREVRYYRIRPDLTPEALEADSETAVVLVNYYGVMESRIRELAEKFPKVIIDNAHAFYGAPILREGVMNVYSCRKFFGVSDGAYLVGSRIVHPELPQDVSYERGIHLTKSIECGTNGAYLENKHNELVVGDRDLAMSRLTRRILEGVDYEDVARRRRENFRFLQKRFGRLQLLDIPEAEPVPYMYPLLLDRDIHSRLVQEKIYIPRLWGQLMEEPWNGTLEQHYAACIHPLPLDQRYGPEEMEYMVRIIEDILSSTEKGGE